MTDWPACPYLAPNSLHCCDWLDLMQALPAGSVDMILTDPPYGLYGIPFVFPHKRYTSINETWDRSVPLEWLAYSARVLKPSAVIAVFGVRNSIYAISHQALALGYRIVNDITWFKPNAPPCFTGRNLTESTERVLILSPTGRNWVYNLHNAKLNNGGRNLRDVWVGNGDKGNNVHPAQKPLWIMKRLIELFCSPSGLVIDPFVGSGTTAVAAKITGREFICGDNSPEYIDIADRRVNIEFGKPPKRKRESLPLEDLPLFAGLAS